MAAPAHNLTNCSWQGLFYDFNRIKGSPATLNVSICNLTNCSWQGLFHDFNRKECSPATLNVSVYNLRSCSWQGLLLDFNSGRYGPATLNVPTSSDKHADVGINPCGDLRVRFTRRYAIPAYLCRKELPRIGKTRDILMMNFIRLLTRCL